MLKSWVRLVGCLLVVAWLSLDLSSVYAQADRDPLLGKDGLIIGLGIGGGVASTTLRTTQFEETTETNETSAALAGDFKLGAGLGERVLLYWFGKSGWYDGPGSFGAATQTSTIFAVSGVGSSYFIASRFALSGGVGVTTFTANRETYFGPGFVVGAEYEFARHWFIDIDVMFGNPDPEAAPGVDREASALLAKVTLNWLYY